MTAGESPVVVLKSGEDDRLRRGHPWIFKDEIERVEGGGEGLARLRSSTFEDLGWGHYNPRGKLAFRWLDWRGPIDEAFYKGRLEKALELRRRAFPGEDAYRLCFGESDGLPGLVVDRYGKYLVAQIVSAGMDRDWPLIQSALVSLLSPAGILLRNDSELRKSEGLPPETRLAWGDVPAETEIRSGFLKFVVPLAAGQKTGFYFDQRRNREFAGAYCEGRRVLDVHCYLGAFALEAARRGARVALGVDSSAQAVELANRNARLNGLATTACFDQGDGEELLKELSRAPAERRPEVVFIDPPNFAHHKAALESARYAYARLFARGFKLVPVGGLVGLSTCSGLVSAALFRKIVDHAARQAKRKAEPIAFRGQSEDHPVLAAMPETAYLHFGLLRVVG